MRSRTKNVAVVKLVVAAALVFSSTAAAHEIMPKSPPPRVKKAICSAFKSHCQAAIRVSWCESRWKTRAKNGQYLGIFQMGEWERRTYGHGRTAIMQAMAAARYFADMRYTWIRWECRYAA